ncbi:MAG: zinc ribbon domain-containing protein [Myxococcota bacterium]|nr:zinc ribbon domain-containing protein [Myxococcota bacterium]
MKCPSCGKKNTPGARSCLYCSTVLDPELDRLMQEVLTGKKAPQSLLSAMSKEEEELPHLEIETVPLETESPLPMLDEGAISLVEQEEDFEELQVIYQHLIQAENREQKKILLNRLAQRALQFKRNLGRDVDISWGNKYVALFMEGLGDVDKGSSLSDILSVPRMRARSLASRAHPSFALWADKKADLEDKLRRYRAFFGLRSAMISKALVLQQPSAQSCLGFKGKAFLICDQPLWLDKREYPVVEQLIFIPKIAVLGMVEEVFFRHTTQRVSGRLGQKKRQSVRVKSREERIGVIDLHGEGVCIRIVEGVSDFSSLPGYDASSERRSFQKLCDVLPVWFSEMKIIPLRISKIQKDLSEENHSTAWPEWETYSRSCRLLYGID